MSTATRFLFLRHGATRPNVEGVRCGGDLDVALTEAGREQAHEAGRRLAAGAASIGVVVTSDLHRTRETAAIVAEALGGLRVVVQAGFRERLLGGWNGLPIADTEAWLRAGRTPPGGEADTDFILRIDHALDGLVPLLAERPLLVASKGVARALGHLLGRRGTAPLNNAELAEFDLAHRLAGLEKDIQA